MHHESLRGEQTGKLLLDDLECDGGEELSFDAGNASDDQIMERAAASSVTIGWLRAFDREGRPLVEVVGRHSFEAIPARTLAPLTEQQLGAEVALAFLDGDLTQPLIVGVVQTPRLKHQGVEAKLDGERVELCAKEEIVLRCGHASITLTRAGKVIIRGAYVLSRSSGVNRIKGGSVQIN